MDKDEAMRRLREAEQGGPPVGPVRVTGPNSLHSPGPDYAVGDQFAARMERSRSTATYEVLRVLANGVLYTRNVRTGKERTFTPASLSLHLVNT